MKGSSVALALACLLLAGCGLIDWLGGKRLKQSYCEQHPGNTDCQQQYPDADTRCRSNADCMAPMAVCDLGGSRACVQCVAPDQTAACGGTTPTCGADDACHACSRHQDCPLSLACMPDGSCAQMDQVAYVNPMTGSGSDCTLASPCKLLTDALKKKRPIVKLTDSINESGTVQITDQTVTLLADPGTQLARTSPGVILTVDGMSTVQVVDLTIADGLGATGIGISLPAGNSASLSLLRAMLTNDAGGGIVATGGTVTVSRSTIIGNAGGGISLSGSEFDITNSIIAGNGAPQSSFGGIRLDQANTGTRRLDFNTITDNVAADGSSVGAVCTLITKAVTFSSNIVYANQIGGTRTQVGGANCNWAYSDIGPDTATGTNNINADPMFVNPSQNNFHLQPTSPAKDKADPNASVNVDIDGDTRPQGAGFDIGADEIK